MTTTSYTIALGSNRRTRFGSPRATLAAAVAALGGVVAQARLVESAPIGPSRRRFANGVVLIETDETPPVLLVRLKQIEAAFGRRRGQRWGARSIDLDIIWWSHGAWASRGLIVPHPHFRERAFVLGPLAQILPNARDPVSGLTMRQLAARLARG